MLHTIFHEKGSYGWNLSTYRLWWLTLQGHNSKLSLIISSPSLIRRIKEKRCTSLIIIRTWRFLFNCHFWIANFWLTQRRMVRRKGSSNQIRRCFNLLQKRSWCLRQIGLGYFQSALIWKDWTICYLQARRFLEIPWRYVLDFIRFLKITWITLQSCLNCQWCFEWCCCQEIWYWSLVPRIWELYGIGFMLQLHRFLEQSSWS